MNHEEVTLGEVYRGIQRLETDMKELRGSAVQRSELCAVEKDVRDLQDTNRWLSRTALGALCIAILDPALRLFGLG